MTLNKITQRRIIVLITPITHHSSRIFLVSGQAQHALHFDFSPAAVTFPFVAGVGVWVDDGAVDDSEFPIARTLYSFCLK